MNELITEVFVELSGYTGSVKHGGVVNFDLGREALQLFRRKTMLVSNAG